MCVKDEAISECVSTFGSREKYLELGRGVNPLPIRDLPGIYETVLPALAVAALVT